MDVAGIRVGHADRRGEGWLSGTTVVLAPPGGAVAGGDVRGGGPGTRETDLLDPRTLVERVHAVVLTGGSAFGLAAADGVMRRLREDGVGFAVGQSPDGVAMVVPIVPAAVVFDLGRGGIFANHPDADLGAAAYDCAVRQEASGAVQQGVVGVGTGCVADRLKGGVGSASAVLGMADGAVATVAALVAVNAFGSCVDQGTGELLAVRFGLPGEFDDAPRPRRAGPPAPGATAAPGALGGVMPATTLAVIATDLTLTKAQCAKVAGIGHDGMARAIRSVHTMVDGDTVFTLATAGRSAPDLAGVQALLAAASDCVTRAIGHAMLAAESVTTRGGTWPCYREWAIGAG
jgi:putative pantetheine hydrolase